MISCITAQATKPIREESTRLRAKQEPQWSWWSPLCLLSLGSERMQNRWVRVRRKREANDTLRFVALTSEVGGVVNRGRHNWKYKTHLLSGTDPLHSQPYLSLTSNTSNWKRQLICLFLFSNFSSVSLHSSRIHAMHESLHYVCIHNWFKIQHLPFCEISNLASIFGITYLKSN